MSTVVSTVTVLFSGAGPVSLAPATGTNTR
jgi:hypothetical protein